MDRHIMEADYQNLELDYRRAADQDAATPVHHPVVVVGAGPVGLSAAIDLASHGVPVVVLDDDNRLSVGSRAICFSKRTLEIWDRLGVGERVTAKGVQWNVGRVFFRDQQVYAFDLLSEAGHRRPAFVNLQQYYAEGYLYDLAVVQPGIDLRWRNRVTGVERTADRVSLEVETPDGPYRLTCDWLIAADGARSPVRGMLGLESKGQVFRDRFLIADVRMQAEFPSERWFWFDPPFHPNQSVLLHRQPDDVWRIDFQLGWDADPAAERQPERVIPRVKALLGEDVAFELVWVSVYTFACLRMDAFRHGRVLFAGDAAHGVSPFGARGANSGVQDTDNLAWKLALVVAGKAPEALLDTYAREREQAADENILASTRATDFITPKNTASRIFREATLQLARDHAFARRFVNSGRLSVPAVLRDTPLSTPDPAEFSQVMEPGTPAPDAPMLIDGGAGWLLAELGGCFDCVIFAGGDGAAAGDIASAARALAALAIPVRVLVVAASQADAAQHGDSAADIRVMIDRDGLACQRWDGRPGTVYLLRPDQHVAARWRSLDLAAIEAAVARATCNATSAVTAAPRAPGAPS